MASVAAADARDDPIRLARRHAMLRFAVGVALAFVICEAMEWYPTFLAPVLLGVLLTSLPTAPPFKVGLALVLVMAGATAVAFVLPSLLHAKPIILVGAVGVVIFLAFVALTLERAKLPALLLLVCMVVLPVLVMVAPAQAEAMSTAMVRAMILALLVLWCVYAVWPRLLPRTAPPASAAIASPVKTALVGTAVVMPVMLAFLMFGLADAVPVLMATVLLVINFDVRQGTMQGVAMMLANLVGGFAGLIAYLLLGIAPSLVTLALIVFLVAMTFAVSIDRGGLAASIGLIASNASLIILSSAILSGPSNSGIWLARLTQFAIACSFAIGMMILVWGKKSRVGNGPPGGAAGA